METTRFLGGEYLQARKPLVPPVGAGLNRTFPGFLLRFRTEETGNLIVSRETIGENLRKPSGSCSSRTRNSLDLLN
jgi:hypothetical protein